MSPPGLPHSAAGIFEQDGKAGLTPFHASTGEVAQAPGSETPAVGFKWRGVFKGLKTRKPWIKISGTCNGETHTRTYTWKQS